MINPHQKGFAKLVAMIEALDVGMLTTVDQNGLLRSRPMATQKADEGRLYFFTLEVSPKLGEIGADVDVNINYADPCNQIYVSVTGKAKAYRDLPRIREIWSDSARRWFPHGPEDPNLVLLTVEIVQAEYWDVDASAMVDLLDRHASADEIIAATDHRKLG